MLGGSFLGLNLPAFSKKRSKLEEVYMSAVEGRSSTGKSAIGLREAPLLQVRVAFIGVGSRGMGHVKLAAALAPDKATITAVCDIRQERVDMALDFLKKEKKIKAAGYGGKEESWREMLDRDDIDLVIVCTPWEDHAPMSIGCMRAGKHVACEVPLAITLDECWDLVQGGWSTVGTDL